jgi:hypothetical protein
LLIGAEGAKTPAGVRGWGDPTGAKRRGGSPARPRKAKRLERKSTTMFNRTKKLKGIEILKVCNFFKKRNYEIDSSI